MMGGVQHERAGSDFDGALRLTQEGESSGRWSRGVALAGRDLLLNVGVPCCLVCWGSSLDDLEACARRLSLPRPHPIRA
jgi:hypothetical protein